MKNFFNVGWDDIDSAIDCLVNPQQFINQVADSPEESTQKLVIKALFSQLYSDAQKRRFQKDLTSKVIVDHEWNAQSGYSNYFDNAQYLASVLTELEPVRIFAGPSASNYLKVMSMFAPVQTSPLGIHLIGNFSNAGVYRAPTSIIPDNVIYIETDKSIIKYSIKDLRGCKDE